MDLRQIRTYDAGGCARERRELVVDPAERCVRPRSEEVRRPQRLVRQRAEQFQVESGTRRPGGPQPGQLKRESAGVAQGPQGEDQLVQRRDRETHFAEVVARELVLDHEAVRYISGPGDLRMPQLSGAWNPPRSARASTRLRRGRDVAVPWNVLRRQRA